MGAVSTRAKAALRGRYALAAACTLWLGATPAQGQTVDELRGMSIDELAQVKVMSASKRAEPLSAAAAAIYVITQEDIQRAAGSSLPEILRLAPNLNVQRIDARQHSVNARGFGGYETSNKLLVLIDGRSVYSTLHSGVFWDLRQIPLDDIAQIEVISGPGGALWGANAVNGIINVTSASALDTLGGRARFSGGPLEQTAMLRYGMPITDAGALRIYANGYNRRGYPAARGRTLKDGGEGIRGGFRADFTGGNGDLTLQGDIFDQQGDGDSKDSGRNMLARWTRETRSGGSIQVQAYYDGFRRDFEGVLDKLDTYDLSFQHNLGSEGIVWGGGVRATHDLFVNTANPFTLDPQSRWLWNGNVFAQWTRPISQQLTLTAGAKLERAAFAGFEFLPSVRLAWQPGERTLLWSAVSRAIRTPSRIDRNLVYPGILEGGSFRSEKLTAIEAGYRGQPTDNMTLSVSLFYNLYDGIRTTAFTPVTIIPVRLSNGLRGHSYGVEAWGSVQVMPAWRLSAGLSTVHKDFRLKPGQGDLENSISLGNDPDYQLQLRSMLDIGRAVTLDLTVRAVDSLPNPHVKTFIDADARLGWKPTPAVELFVSGTNLLHDRRDESGDTDRGQLVRRVLLAGTTLAF